MFVRRSSLDARLRRCHEWVVNPSSTTNNQSQPRRNDGSHPGRPYQESGCVTCWVTWSAELRCLGLVFATTVSDAHCRFRVSAARRATDWKMTSSQDTIGMQSWKRDRFLWNATEHGTPRTRWDTDEGSSMSWKRPK